MSRVKGQLCEPPIESLTAFEIKTICELMYADKNEDTSESENESNDYDLSEIDKDALPVNEEPTEEPDAELSGKEESDNTAPEPESVENDDASVSENTEKENETGIHISAGPRMPFISRKKNESLFVFEGKNDFLILGVFFLLIAFFLIGGFYLNSK